MQVSQSKLSEMYDALIEKGQLLSRKPGSADHTSQTFDYKGTHYEVITGPGSKVLRINNLTHGTSITPKS